MCWGNIFMYDSYIEQMNIDQVFMIPYKGFHI